MTEFSTIVFFHLIEYFAGLFWSLSPSIALSSFVALVVMPTLVGAQDEAVAVCILVAWCVTEAARYPWILCCSPKSGVVRKLRYIIPVFTYPLGVLGEAYACWRFYSETHAFLLIRNSESVRVEPVRSDIYLFSVRCLFFFSSPTPHTHVIRYGI